MIDRAELQLAVGDGARAVARHYLKNASEASVRLVSGARDDEALHDFRVAVRRLRSWLRAFDVELPEVRKRDHRELKRIAHATNAGRDAEVQLEWIGVVAKRGSALQKRGAAWLGDVIAERRARSETETAELVGDAWPQLEARLRDCLDDRKGDDARETLAPAIVGRIAKDAHAMRGALADVHSITDESLAHEARIAAKRLRYLIEPAAAHVASGEALRDRLKALQDDFGALHDLHVLAGEVASLAESSAAGEARREIQEALGAFGVCLAREDAVSPAPSGSLVAISKRLRKDLEARFAKIEERWLGQPDLLSAELDTFAHELTDLGNE